MCKIFSHIQTYKHTMAMTTATFWAMTINNPEDNDRAIVTNGYPDYVRALIHTDEVGEDGTPHIQAWIKLQKQQRMSFVKKLFPRGHFTPFTKDEYELNTRRYVQKNDETTAGVHIQKFNDPIPDCVSILKRFCTEVIEYNRDQFARGTGKSYDIRAYIKHMESDAVVENPYNAKIFVSPTYTRIKKLYLDEIFSHAMDKINARDQDSASQDESDAEEQESNEDGSCDGSEDTDGEGEDGESGFSSDDGGSEDSEGSYGE